MTDKFMIVVLFVACTISAYAADDQEQRRDVKNKLREIFRLGNRNLDDIDRDHSGNVQKRLLQPSESLMEKVRREEQKTLGKRLAFPDPFYNRYLDRNEITGTCVHGGIVFQGGMTIHTPGCREECFCTIKAGRPKVVCSKLKCSIPKCVNYIYEFGMCCPLCLSGDNCWANSLGENHIIPGGLDILLPHGRCQKKCMCPAESQYKEEGDKTQAICAPLC